MNAVVKEWVDKAEADYRVAARESKVAENANYDAVCFHAHQCIEKLMKALLIHLKIEPPRTHNLVWLSNLLAPLCPAWIVAESDLRCLTQGASAFRYPGATAEREDSVHAMAICARLRQRLLERLGSFGEN